jgi:ubiquitin-protein ligase
MPLSTLSSEEVRVRRRLLLQDLSDFLQPVSEGAVPLIHAAPEAHDFLQWRAVLCGPVHSAWQHITLQLRVVFPSDYPSSPPRITFDTRVFHPNVSLEDGSICASVLKPGGWSPAYRLHALLVALQSLLDAPNAESPLHAQAAKLFLQEPAQHQPVANENGTLCYWRQVYQVHEQNMEQWTPKAGSTSACTDDAIMELTPPPRLHRSAATGAFRQAAAGNALSPADNAVTAAAGPSSSSSRESDHDSIGGGGAAAAATAAVRPVPLSVCSSGDESDEDGDPFTTASRLSQCARQFVATAQRGTLGRPYKLHRDQRAALLRAVEARVMRESSSTPSVAAPTAAVAAPLGLSSRDRTQVEAVIQLLLTQPGCFVQLHGVLPRPKGRKAAVQPTVAISLDSPLHELQALHEFLRDTGLAQGIGTASALPDDRYAVRDSLRMDSLMEEAAFSRLLQQMVQQHALTPLPIVHMPLLLLSTWAREATAGGALMLAWCQERRDALLGAKYVVFHWSDGHYCSLVLNVDVWRRGPRVVVASSEANGHAASSESTEAAQHASSSSSSSSSFTAPSSATRARKKRKTIAAVPFDSLYSDSDVALPILHLDTMACACQFQDDTADTPASSMLARICHVWNRLCDTAWPESPSTAVEHLRHLCGPAQQPDDDDWSCSYRLLQAWRLIYDDMATRTTTGDPEAALTPRRINEACSSLAADSVRIEQLVQDMRTQFTAIASSSSVQIELLAS